jgi:hypothetical protein
MRRILIVAVGTVVLLLAVAAPVAASPSKQITAEYTVVSVDPVMFAVSGDIEGTVVLLKEVGIVSFSACEPCTVKGMTGAMYGIFVDPANEDGTGTWTVLRATGELKGLHGHGT